MSGLPYVIAVDFDGTLVDDNYPAIGFPRWEVIERLRRKQDDGAMVILWTCRTGKLLDQAVDFCKTAGIELAAVNASIPEWTQHFGSDTRKVGANEYWDDRAVPSGLRTMDTLTDTLVTLTFEEYSLLIDHINELRNAQGNHRLTIVERIRAAWMVASMKWQIVDTVPPRKEKL